MKWRHGTVGGYSNHDCRCDPCRAAKRGADHADYVINRVRHNALATAWNAAHPDQRRAIDANWRRHHRALANARTTEWVRHHPDIRAASAARRRARKYGNGGSHTAQEWREKMVLFGGRCAYCGEDRRLVREHRIPLVRGGTDNIQNVVPACQPCNSKKGSKTDLEFVRMVA